MRIKKVQLIKFKRFDDLTIDLGDNPARIVALVGPNGCGKSSVFDAFAERQRSTRPLANPEPNDYFVKYQGDSQANGVVRYNSAQQIKLEFAEPTAQIGRTAFHVRTPYRFTPILGVREVKFQQSMEDDRDRPGSSIRVDSRLLENYQRLLGKAWGEFFADGRTVTNEKVKEDLIGQISRVTQEVLGLRLSNLGNPMEDRGDLFFAKEDLTGLPYRNLSSGEKEVVDLIVDLVVRAPVYRDTVYCIDEPELHLNTAVQRKLLREIVRFVPESCQLWIATHSVGFLRALQEDLREDCAVLDFTKPDLFTGMHVLSPMVRSRTNWQRLFATALDDLAGLVAPRRIVYCEGRAIPTALGEEGGLDARVYNTIFADDLPDTLFVSSGGKHEVHSHATIALTVLSKAFQDADLLLLRDRDETSDADREAFIASAPHHRMLERREIENYLLDAEVVEAYCRKSGRIFSREAYDNVVPDPKGQDLKAGNTIEQVKILCSFRGSHVDFKVALAAQLRPSTQVYEELRRCIQL